MKKSDFTKIGKQLLDMLPRYVVKGDLVYVLAEHRLLGGMCFEGSSFNKETFFVNYFVMPLAKPTQFLYFNFGDRLRDRRGTDGWSATQSDLVEELRIAVKSQVIPWISTFESPREATALINKWANEVQNYRIWETGAVLLASYGDIDGAVVLVDRFFEVCDFSMPWHRNVAEQLNELKEACMESPQALETLLNLRTEQTLINLKLKI